VLDISKGPAKTNIGDPRGIAAKKVTGSNVFLFFFNIVVGFPSPKTPKNVINKNRGGKKQF
jgi:hypothetical protein